MAHIIIDINSDLDPVTFAIDTEEEEAAARKALRDAGLAYEDVWVGEPGSDDAHKTGGKLFAKALAAGDKVESFGAGEDDERGVIVSIDGDMATVLWEQGTQTTADLRSLRAR